MAGEQIYTDPTSPFGKDVWLPGVTEEFEDTPGKFFDMVDGIEPTRMDGRNCFFKLDIGHDLGGGMVLPNGGDFPQPADGAFDEGKLSMARIARTIEVTIDEWEKMRSDAAAAVDVVSLKMSKATKGIVRDLARQTHGDGSSILARCGVTSNSATIVLQTTASNQYDRDRMNWLQARRMYVDIIDSADGTAKATRRLVQSVAADGSSIVISGATITTDTDDVVTWSGSVDPFSDGSYVSGEIVGLGQLMKTDRTWLAVNSATAGKEFWDPVVISGATPGTPEPLAIGHLQRLYIKMAKEAHDGMEPGPATGHSLWSNYNVAASAIASLVDQIQFLEPRQTDGPMDFGFRRVKGLGIEWYTDIHYANNVLDCLRIQGEEGIGFVRPTNPMQGLLDFVTTGSGDMWHMKNASSGAGHASAFWAYLTGLFGMVCKKPSENGRLKDVSQVAA